MDRREFIKSAVGAAVATGAAAVVLPGIEAAPEPVIPGPYTRVPVEDDIADPLEGEPSYVYVAWANDPYGNGFSLTFAPDKDFIAMYATNEAKQPSKEDFMGKWRMYRPWNEGNS